MKVTDFTKSLLEAYRQDREAARKARAERKAEAEKIIEQAAAK